MADVTRRHAVKLTTAAGTIAALVAGSAHAQDQNRRKGKRYTGTSKKGSIEEALDLAIQSALSDAQGADIQVKWILKEISGTRGGFAAVNDLTVTIEVPAS